MKNLSTAHASTKLVATHAADYDSRPAGANVTSANEKNMPNTGDNTFLSVMSLGLHHWKVNLKADTGVFEVLHCHKGKKVHW